MTRVSGGSWTSSASPRPPPSPATAAPVAWAARRRKPSAPKTRAVPSGQYLSVRYSGDGALYLFLGVLEVHEVPGQVLLVGAEVEVPVAAEVEEDDLLFAGLSGLQREVYRRPYGVSHLRRGDDAFGLREEPPGLEGRVLGVGAGLDQALVHERRYDGRVAVVAQAAGVDASRHERVPQRVHLHQGRRSGGVAEVVCVASLRERGARGRLDGEDARL